MKVILAAVNAKYIHSNLAVFSLRAYAAQHGQEAEIAEYTINHQPEHILMDLYKRKPDVLAFSCYIWNIEMILELAEEFSLLCPETDIWLGGPEVSWHATGVSEVSERAGRNGTCEASGTDGRGASHQTIGVDGATGNGGNFLEIAGICCDRDTRPRPASAGCGAFYL